MFSVTIFLFLISSCTAFTNIVEGWNHPGWRLIRNTITKRIPQGLVRGEMEFYDGLSRSHIVFRGIPYAQAPVGDLRWRPPRPAPGWNGIRHAGLYGPNCPQISGRPTVGVNQMFVMHEDCLYINVFTPNDYEPQSLPVIFHIHAGGFSQGSGDPNLQGFEFPVNDNFIYVTFNYRLDVFGHLNTEDEHATGNYALQDTLMALQWVQDNIEYFGGDKNCVTLMGPTAGGVIVHALLLSEHARGLFHRAISLSGSLFQTYAVQPNPRRQAEALATLLGIEIASDMVAQLRAVSSDELINATATFLPMELPSMFVPSSFVPSIDAPGAGDVKLLPVSPDILARNGTLNDVPLLVGFNSVSSMTNMLSPGGLQRFNDNPHLLIPDAWQIEPDSSEANEIIDSIRRTYFNGSEVITPEMLWQWTQFCSDRENTFGVSKLVDLHHSRQPTFYYRFSYSGSFSYFQQNFNLMQHPGAMSLDEQLYIHRMNRPRNPVPVSDHAFVVRRRLMTMIFNFARTGNPTPTPQVILQNIHWPQVTDEMEFLDIGHNLTVGTHPFKKRMDMWRDFDRRFNKF